MQIKLPILDLSKDLFAITKCANVEMQLNKVREELQEYEHEGVGLDESCDEWFDVLQAWLQLGKLEFTHEQIQQAAQRHYAKLQSRDRRIVGKINISVEVD